MTDYIEIISNCFPDAEVYVLDNLDPSVYANVQWITTPIDQATLDASECAVSIETFSGNEVTFADTFGQVLEIKFSKSSNAVNAWLSYNGMPSDDNPSLIPFNGKIVGLSFSNDNTDVSTDMEIYVTPKGSEIPVLKHTWEIRNARKGYNTSIPEIVFAAGSKISIFFKNAGKAPRNVDVSVYQQVISAEPVIHIENS